MRKPLTLICLSLGLVLALAGMQIVRRVDDLSVVFVLDHSDSVSQAEQQRAEEFIRTALRSLVSRDTTNLSSPLVAAAAFSSAVREGAPHPGEGIGENG